MSFYEQNDSGLSPSAYDLPLPSGDSAPDSNYRFNINKFKLTTPKIEATVENVIKFRDELERAFGAMNIHDYLELPEYVPPDLNLTYPVINHTSQADNIPDLADEVVRKVEDLMIENANRLSREVLFYKTKNGWYPWEEGHYKRPMVCIDDIVQPMPDEMLYPEPRLVEPPKAEEDQEQAPDIEAIGRSLKAAMFGGAALILGILKLGEAIFSEKEPLDKFNNTETESKKHLQDEPASAPPYLDKKRLFQRELEFLVKVGFFKEGLFTMVEGKDYAWLERRRVNVLTKIEAIKLIENTAKMSEEQKQAIYIKLRKYTAEVIYFDDENLYTLLTLSHGPSFAEAFVNYRENTRRAWKATERSREELDQLLAEGVPVRNDNPRTNRVTELTEKLKETNKQMEAAWLELQKAFSFEIMFSDAKFKSEQAKLQDEWATNLRTPEVSADLYTRAQKVRSSFKGDYPTEVERPGFVAALIELLRAALKAAWINDPLQLVDKIELKIDSSFKGTENAVTNGNKITFNYHRLFDEIPLNFADIIRTLFHEAAHVIQHNMTEQEFEKVFGKMYYMNPDISLSLYVFQRKESHAVYMAAGIEPEKITNGW